MTPIIIIMKTGRRRATSTTVWPRLFLVFFLSLCINFSPVYLKAGDDLFKIKKSKLHAISRRFLLFYANS